MAGRSSTNRTRAGQRVAWGLVLCAVVTRHHQNSLRGPIIRQDFRSRVSEMSTRSLAGGGGFTGPSWVYSGHQPSGSPKTIQRWTSCMRAYSTVSSIERKITGVPRTHKIDGPRRAKSCRTESLYLTYLGRLLAHTHSSRCVTADD
jgi:hypothetical protein